MQKMEKRWNKENQKLEWRRVRADQFKKNLLGIYFASGTILCVRHREYTSSEGNRHVNNYDQCDKYYDKEDVIGI